MSCAKCVLQDLDRSGGAPHPACGRRGSTSRPSHPRRETQRKSEKDGVTALRLLKATVLRLKGTARELRQTPGKSRTATTLLAATALPQSATQVACRWPARRRSRTTTGCAAAAITRMLTQVTVTPDHLPSFMGMTSGVVAGLVAVTPALSPPFPRRTMGDSL